MIIYELRTLCTIYSPLVRNIWTHRLYFVTATPLIYTAPAIPDQDSKL